jgi:hypothetical protein
MNAKVELIKMLEQLGCLVQNMMVWNGGFTINFQKYHLDFYKLKF